MNDKTQEDGREVVKTYKINAKIDPHCFKKTCLSKTARKKDRFFNFLLMILSNCNEP